MPSTSPWMRPTTACACLVQQKNGDFVTRILANRSSLWSLDAIWTESVDDISRYAQVFRPELSARTVWRAVQAQRCVIKTMQKSGRTSMGVRKTFFENARWVILNVLFLKLRPEQRKMLSLG
ncbi:MAG: AIPR protein [Magnetococcales bacterium]|nr:AIPR protein [Magnetococcales bacterium]